MDFVLDASITACWVLDDEEHPVAVAVLDTLRRASCIAPALWWFETRNVLLTGERRKRITQQQTSAFLMFLAKLDISLDSDPDGADVLRLARFHRLTFYDASYLELALRKRLPLATLDSDLLRAARAESIEIVGAHRLR